MTWICSSVIVFAFAIWIFFVVSHVHASRRAWRSVKQSALAMTGPFSARAIWGVGFPRSVRTVTVEVARSGEVLVFHLSGAAVARTLQIDLVTVMEASRTRTNALQFVHTPPISLEISSDGWVQIQSLLSDTQGRHDNGGVGPYRADSR